MSECKHGLEERWCATCNPPEPLFVDREGHGTRFVASFDGQCSGCLLNISAGDSLTALDGEYLCDDCAPTPEPEIDLGGPFST